MDWNLKALKLLVFINWFKNSQIWDKNIYNTENDVYLFHHQGISNKNY